MKKTMFYFFILTICSFEIMAQQNSQPYQWYYAMSDVNANYYDIYDAATAHFDTVPDDPLRKTFLRWNAFWKNRHGGDGDPGTFAPAYNSLYTSFTDPSIICDESPDGFENWTSLGPHEVPPLQTYINGMGIVAKILVDIKSDPEGNIAYAGTNASGVWKTENAMAQNPADVIWEQMPDSRIGGMGVLDLDIDSDGNLFASTGYEARLNNQYGIGLVKFNQANNTWEGTDLTISPSSYKRSLAVDIFLQGSGNDYILAGVENSLYISRNGGATFGEPIFTHNSAYNDYNQRPKFNDVVFHPTNPNIFYAAVNDIHHNDGTAAKVFRFNYDPIEQLYDVLELTEQELGFLVPSPRIDIETFEDEPDHVYVFGGSPIPNMSTLSKSTDAGISWTALSNPQFTGSWFMNDFSISQLDANKMIHGRLESFVSVDGGLMWSQSTIWDDLNNSISLLHADNRDVEVVKVLINNVGEDVIFIGHDGGVGRSLDFGTNWEDISNGLNIAQFYGFDVAEDYSYIVGGCQDISFLWYDTKTKQWRNPENQGDGINVEIDQYDDNFVFGHNQTGFKQSTQLGFPGDFGTANSPPQFVTMGAIIPMESHENGNLYVGSDNIYIRDKGTGVFGGAIGNGPNAGRGRGMAISKDAETIYFSIDEYWAGASTGLGGFWVTNNAHEGVNANWTDLTATCTPFDHGMINSIVMHPYEKEKLWVGINRFVSGRKVFYSDDGGDSWINKSGLLPNFPVNCMVYHEGADVLYLGTDVGVYYLSDPTNPFSLWQCLNKGFPTCIVMDLELNYCENKLIAATHGRGLWELDLPQIDNETPREITQNTVWGPNSYHTLNTDLIIRSGNTLTVYGEVHIGKRKRIIVEKNAKLRVHGGKLTNICQGPWEGIIVEGDKSLPQRKTGNLYDFQGFVQLNNATIENAADAIRLWNPYDYSSSGGVVEAYDTDFINNGRSVEFIDYQNFVVLKSGAQAKVGNASRFERCNFLTTPGYDDVNHSSMPLPHVTMWRVHSIPYRGCTFSNSYANLGLDGAGLNALDASFVVTNYISGSGNVTESLFEGMRHGIRSQYVNTPSTYLVHNTTFRDNITGIFNSGVDNPRITNCDFSVGYVSTAPFPNNGIYLNGGTGYIIENNSFEGEPLGPVPSIGIVARETGNELNVIYKNDFETMDYANLSNGDNTGGNVSDPESPFKGLKYECNTNNLGVYDFSIPLELTLPYGVSAIQSGSIGSNTTTPLAAGNIFTDELSNTLVSQFSNQGGFLDYHANSLTSSEIPSTSFITGVNLVLTQFINGCEDHMFTGGDTKLREDERSILEQTFNENSQLLNTLKQSFNNQLDGGNTSSLVNSIIEATNSDAIQLKTQLLNVSPYLSQPVLMAVADRSPEIFSHNDLFEICEANPDELNQSLFDHLSIQPNPLPENQMNALQSFSGQNTERTELLGQMSGYAIEVYQSANLLIHDLLLDSTYYDVSRLRNWWTNKTSLASDYSLIDSYMGEGEISKAQQLSNSLATKYNLTDVQTTDYNNYLLLQTIEIALINENRNWPSLMNDELGILLSVAENDMSRSGKKAQNILSFFYGFDYFREAILPIPSIQPISIPNEETIQDEKMINEFEWVAYPNPATNEVIIQYKLATDAKNPVLLVSDSDGRVILEQTLDVGDIQYVWNASKMKRGLYFYTLRYDDQIQQTKQILLMK